MFIDREGRRTRLSEGWISVHGFAWSSDGNEIWFGATKGEAVSGDGIYAVSRHARLRTVLVGPGRYKLLDIAPDGRVLIGNEHADRVVEAMMAGSTAPTEIGVKSNSSAPWISNDGTTVLISDQSTASYETYLLKAGAAPVHLGVGTPSGISPDGRWVLAQPVEAHPLFLHPTGPGETRKLPDPDGIVFNPVTWLDPTHVIGFAQKPGATSRGYVQDITSGVLKPFTPEGVTANAARWWALPISPDGKRVVGTDDHGGAHDPAGLRLSVLAISRDAKYWVHSYSRLQSDLYIVEGLK